MPWKSSMGVCARLRETTFRNSRLHNHFGREKSSQRDFKVRRPRLHGQPPPWPFGHLEAFRRSKSNSDNHLHLHPVTSQ